MGAPALVFAMTGCRALAGGIAGANANALLALSALALERRSHLAVLSYLEADQDRPDFLPPEVAFLGFRGEKLRFVRAVLSLAVRRPLFCFDHVTLAPPLLPFAALGLVRSVILAHGSEAWKRVRTSSRWSLRVATLCLANSEFTARRIRERLPGLSVAACPLGLSPIFRLNESLPTSRRGPIELDAADGATRRLGQRVLLLVGRLDPREREKGHRQLIGLLPRLFGEFPDVQLVFPGPGADQESVRDLAQRTGVGAAVFLPGHVSVFLLERLYATCYAFVMPSRQEGFGLAYLEAMNYGKPCVGCHNQGAEEVIVEGETGFLVHDPDDQQELGDTLLKLLRNPALSQSLGSHGFRRLHERFTPRHHQQRLKEAIARVF